MQNLIVLGQIPGTDIQINFMAWIILTIIAVFLASVWLMRRARLIRNWLVITWLVLVMHQRPHLKA